jgi:predicted hydrocarbon binding protein
MIDYRNTKMPENIILKDMIFDESHGALSYKGVRYLLIRPETIAGFQKALHESCGEDPDEKFFSGGFQGGSLSAKKYRELYNFSDSEIIEFMMSMGGQIGWGRFRLERYDPKLKILHVSVAHSPFAESYGKSTQGVCHLTRGVLCGMAAILFDQDCTATETECRARGDERCLFVVKGK